MARFPLYLRNRLMPQNRQTKTYLALGINLGKRSASLLKTLPNIDTAIVGEPTQMHLACIVLQRL